MANGGRPRRWFRLVFFLLAFLPLASVQAGVEARTQVVPVPLFFEANVGQAAPGVKFLARGQGLGAVVGSDDIALTFLEPDGPPSTAGDDGRARIERRRRTFSSTGVHFRIKGGSLAHAVGLDEVPGRSNYFRGDDPARWHTNIRHYAGLKIPAVRPGIDLVFHGDGDRLEYDFVVAPGAEPGAIEVEFEGMSEMVIGTGGELLLRTRLGFIRQEPPVVYQEDAGQRRLLRGRCVRRGPTSVAFEVPDFDRRKPLVIDPVLSYTQVFGGSENDFTRGLAVGSNGEIVVVGTTTSPDFPAQNGYGGGGDAFVTKLSPSGAIMFSTYLGGSSFDEAGGAAVDASGAVYVAGTTGSMDFPGCPCAVGGFVAKLDVTGNLVYSNVSLAGDVRVFDLKLGPAGLLYAAGQVRAPNGWFDAFGAKLDPSSGTMTWFTRLPGDRDDFALALAVDGQGDTVLTGGTNSPGPGTNPEYDAFVARLDAGGGLIYLRYIIGTAFEEGTNVAVDGAGRAYAQIWTASTDLPTTPGAFQPASAGNYDTAVVRLDAAGAIELLTYFGGNGRDTPRGIAVDGSGAIFLAGSTQGGLPIKDAFQPTFGGPAFGTDAFVAELDPTGASLVFSSYLGSTERENAWEMALDGSGNMIVAGTVTSVFARTQIMVAKIGIAAAHIDILGSTTRWRAQRDTSKNIAVNFSGPDDLETAKLTVTEVKDSDGKPVSFPADYQPDTGTFDPTMKNADPTVSGPTYRLVWKGPWTLPNGDRLPPGNYTLVVEGTQKNQTTPMQSAPYSKVSVVEVTSVKFDAMPGAPPLEANPAVPALPGESADRARTGGGSAIFVEATDAPTDASPNPTVYDRVKVIATIEPEVTDAPADDPVRVYFRSIDVDDPIKNTPTIDDEAKGYDNCIQSADAPQCYPSPNGYPFDLDKDPNATMIGPATIDVQASAKEVAVGLVVSRQQGDNYRVGVSTYSQWVTDLEAIQGTGEGELRHKSGESLLDSTGQFKHPQVSEMLTVWRTLRLEVDQMVSQDPAADQEVLDLRRDFSDLKEDNLKDDTAPFMQVGVHPLKGGWIGAFLSLEFHTSVSTGWDGVDLSQPLAIRYQVSGNDMDNVDVIVPKKGVDLRRGLKSAEIKALTRRRYLVRDDEITSLQSSADTSLASALLAEAYIRLAPVVKDPALSQIPFLIKPGDPADRRNLTSVLFGLPPSQPPLSSSASYWSTGLVSGFEGDRFNDGDPRPNRDWTNKGDGAASPDGYELGVTGPSRIGTTSGPVKLRSVIHMETIRDFKENPPEKIPPRAATPLVPLKLSPDVNKRVTAHEILHTMRLIHDDGIMCGGINVQDTSEGGILTDAQLKTVRFKVKEPFQENDPNQTCPPK